jgi:hypothetical protein
LGRDLTSPELKFIAEPAEAEPVVLASLAHAPPMLGSGWNQKISANNSTAAIPMIKNANATTS